VLLCNVIMANLQNRQLQIVNPSKSSTPNAFFGFWGWRFAGVHDLELTIFQAYQNREFRGKLFYTSEKNLRILLFIIRFNQSINHSNFRKEFLFRFNQSIIPSFQFPNYKATIYNIILLTLQTYCIIANWIFLIGIHKSNVFFSKVIEESFSRKEIQGPSAEKLELFL